MNILVTICARAGSKGVKSKNTREFCGYPILYHTLAAYELFLQEYGEQYNNIQLAVNTDSDVLIGQMDKTKVSYRKVDRKKEQAGDFVAKIDVIRDTLLTIEKQTNKIYDITIDLDLTSPLRTVEDIKGTLDTVLQDAEADISFSVTESRRSPYFNMVQRNEDGYYKTVITTTYVSRQQVPMCYDMNASIYAYKRQFLLSDKPNERNALIWKMRDTAVLDIDSENDYEILGILAEYYVSKDAGIKKLQDKIKDII